MKKLLLFSAFSILFFSKVNSQTVDQSINGVQIGLLGIWVHNESKLDLHWALRTELGFEAPYTSGFSSYGIFTPVVSIEPRWYYNSAKRQGNSNNTFHNSTNYASIVFKWIPEFWTTDYKKFEAIDGGVFILPTWGIRRNISYRFNYELAFGAGIDAYEFFTSDSYETDFMFNIHIRIGYKFGRKTFQKD